MSSKYTIVLKNLDFNDIRKKYNFTFFKRQKDVTRLDDIFSSQKVTVSFLDEIHAKHLYNVSCIDLKRSPHYECFWCGHLPPQGKYPLMCPISFVPDQLEKTYYSNMSKVVYHIKEDVSSSVQRSSEVRQETEKALVKWNHFLSVNGYHPELGTSHENQGKEEKKEEKGNKEEKKEEKKHATTYSFVKHSCFVSDGFFCSFNCVQAFIDNNKHDPLYNLSTLLLMKIYRMVFPSNPLKQINAAPHYRLLIKKGGFLTIDEFRNSFDHVEYRYHGSVKYLPVNHLYEEIIKFN